MKKYFFILTSILFSYNTFAQSVTIRVKEYNLSNNLAIQGYDPIAYFKLNKPAIGNKNFATTYLGITYYFSSQSNKDTFLKAPSAYEPQYGGWCAYAMGAKGQKIEIDPGTFKIVDGKLYLFYNAFFNNTLKSWNKDELNLISKAERNWLTQIK